jgi:hypothetical protein
MGCRKGQNSLLPMLDGWDLLAREIDVGLSWGACFPEVGAELNKYITEKFNTVSFDFSD